MILIVEFLEVVEDMHIRKEVLLQWLISPIGSLPIRVAVGAYSS